MIEERLLADMQKAFASIELMEQTTNLTFSQKLNLSKKTVNGWMNLQKFALRSTKKFFYLQDR